MTSTSARHREFAISCSMNKRNPGGVIVIATFATLLCLHAETPPMMKAIVANEYGGPEVLKYEEVPVPKPKENEILVRTIASGVNPADPLILEGKFAQVFDT